MSFVPTPLEDRGRRKNAWSVKNSFTIHKIFEENIYKNTDEMFTISEEKINFQECSSPQSLIKK